MLGPFQFMGEHVATIFALKGQAQGVPVERSGCVSVSNNRGDTCYELNVHLFPPRLGIASTYFSSSYSWSNKIPHYISNVRFSDSELGSEYLARTQFDLDP